ncbi:MAG TPA: fibronectin type III domain-containing protein [Panacibacter sp.]|nr:fibronectin type III domain-containing protein [Panacibacter sp.]
MLVLQPPYSHYKTTKKLTFTDDDVKRGQRYFYRVRGLDRNGYGEWSEPVSRVQ